MMTRILLILLTIFILIGCNTGGQKNMLDMSDFKTEKNYPNGKSKIVYKQFKDTIVNGLTFSFKLKRKLDISGQIEREGYYINDQEIGKHKFYNENKLIGIREFILFTPEQIEFLKEIDTVYSGDLSSRSTYLNATYFLNNGDTIENKSSFCKISPRNPLVTSDSIRVSLEFFVSQIDIKAFELYFDVPGDNSSVRFVQNLGKSIDFGQPIINKEIQHISGFAFIYGNTIEKNSGDTLLATRLFYFQKEFK